MIESLGTICAHLEANQSAPPLHVLAGAEGPETTLSRDELLARARAISVFLRDRGVVEGDRVLTMLPTSVSFIASLIGAWYAGAAVVPSSYARGKQNPRPLGRKLAEMLRIAEPRVLIGDDETLRLLDEVGPLSSSTTVVRAEELMALKPVETEPAVRPVASGTALVQFTSGSTGLPRGVVIRHDQLVEHTLAIGEHYGVTADDSSITWLPLYHDMGFTGGLSCPLVWGTEARLMPTEAFVRNPAGWLRAFRTHGATMTAVPPFALDLLAFRLGEARIENVDLSSWRIVWIGSEPIFEETLAAFRRRYEPRGLDPNALKPCYGLAEATLAVTMTPTDVGARSAFIDRGLLRASGRVERVEPDADGAVPMVSCGVPICNTDIEIRDDDGNVLGPGRQGRVWTRGGFVMSGYFNTDETPIEDGWLDTGDVGFVLDGELYVSGREKDVIKRGGASVQPQDIEWAASSIDGVRRGQSIAFSSPDHEKRREEIVVLVESRFTEGEKRDIIAAEVRSCVASEAGVQIDRVVVVSPGSLPRTSSGKVQRQLAKRMFLDRQFEPVEA